jgi:hypothetical protein
MAKRLLTLLSLLACALLGTAVDASAATKKKARTLPTPTVKSITPMKAGVGEKLTITGTNFLKGKTKVYFLREGGGVAWVMSDTSSATRLVVTVPEKLIPLMRGTAEARKPTRFQIRLLGRRFGAATKLAKSPVLTAPNSAPGEIPGPSGGSGTPPDGDCDGDQIKNSVDPDDDNDALTDDLENFPAHTDPCKADTDGDTIFDGYEFYSAKDINVSAAPYPSKKPWPNPLDSTDAFVDHDGDGLYLVDEHLLWKYYGNLTVEPLNYSAGKQRSDTNAVAPGEPAFAGAVHYASALPYMDVDGNRVLSAYEQGALAYMDMDGDGVLSDDERDADGDGLTNWDEAHGRMLQTWWDETYDGTTYPKETNYINVFPGVSIFEPDTDGDGITDGADDQDHDGLPNAFEVARPSNWFKLSDGTVPGIWGREYLDANGATDGFDDPIANPWARVQPYNPCKPVWSKHCHLHWPDGYYGDDEDWMGPDPRPLNPPPAAPWLYQGES